LNKIYIANDREVKEALSVLEKGLDETRLLSADTETNGFDGRLSKLWSVQLGTRTDSMLFPYFALNQTSKNLLRKFTEDKTLIAHNAKFDYKFMVLNGFGINKVYCTQESEKILWQGKYFTWGLKDVLLRRFQIQLSKEERKDFYDGTFDALRKEFGDFGVWEQRPDLIEYALDDIVYLHELYDDQQKDIKELGMDDLAWLENELVPVVADMEIRGVGLNVEATKKFEGKVTLRRDELSRDIFTALGNSFSLRWQREYIEKMKLWDAWKLDHETIKSENSERDPNDRRRKTTEAKTAVAESNLARPFKKEPAATKAFNPNSPPNLKMALSEIIGIELTTTNKEWLEENINLHPSIATLVEYRKFNKLVEFCAIKDELHERTKRIHASFNQNGTKSGRFSCQDPNLQQIPARSDEAKEFRSLFIAGDGYKFIGADLAGIELVILAYFSEEEGLLEAINSGKDVHCYTMSHLLNCSYETLVALKNGETPAFDAMLEFDNAIRVFHEGFGMPELVKVRDDATAWVKKFRDYVKTLTYGMAYGLTAWGLSVKFHCSHDDAKEFIKRFFGVYGKLKTFIQQEENLGYERKYAENPTGRRRWFSVPKMKSYAQVEAELIKKFDKDDRIWESVTDSEWDIAIAEALKDAKKEYEGKIGYIKRQAGNFFPQSLNADIVKLAMIKFDREFNKVEGVDKLEEGLVLTIHDELIPRVADERTEIGKKLLKESMEYAVHKFMPEIYQNVECEVSDYWKK
jgi:DNA polymerase I-like protein with 3'-5' exonuclease and polymerase domains